MAGITATGATDSEGGRAVSGEEGLQVQWAVVGTHAKDEAVEVAESQTAWCHLEQGTSPQCEPVECGQAAAVDRWGQCGQGNRIEAGGQVVVVSGGWQVVESATVGSGRQ